MAKPNITILLDRVEAGEPQAAARLFDAVYDDLRDIAAGKMAGERENHTLQPTALVNEAFLRLIGNVDDMSCRAHFYGAAALAMERVLVDHAREKRALKRGGQAARVCFDEVRDLAEGQTGRTFGGHLDVLAVHDALSLLAREDEDLAAVVRYRYFVGLTLEEIAALMGGSVSTVRRRWAFARAWLYAELGDEEQSEEKLPSE